MNNTDKCIQNLTIIESGFIARDIKMYTFYPIN
jgi:hypothetical protein